MIDTNIARDIFVEAIVPFVSTMVIEVTITEPDFNIVKTRFEINWSNELSDPVFLKKPLDALCS